MKVKDLISQLQDMGFDESTELRFGYLKTIKGCTFPQYNEFQLKQLYDERQCDQSPNMISFDFKQESIS